MTNLIKDTEKAYGDTGSEERGVVLQEAQKIFSKCLKKPMESSNRNDDILLVSYVKYKMIVANSRFLTLFEELILLYKSNPFFEGAHFIALMQSLMEIDFKAGANFITLAINEVDTSPSSKTDELYLIMNKLGDFLESCIFLRFKEIFSFLSYEQNQNVITQELGSTKFGVLIDRIRQLKNSSLSSFLGDSIYNISLNHWRNIAVHKDYELKTQDKILVSYANNKYSKNIHYHDLMVIFNEINLLNTVLTLFFDLVFIDISSCIKLENVPARNMKLEESLLYIFYNLRLLNYKIIEYGYKNNNSDFELSFENLDENKDTKEGIIALSLHSNLIAKSLCDDQFKKSIPQNIKINLVCSEEILATSSILYSSALDNLYKKKDLDNLFNNTKYTFNN